MQTNRCFINVAASGIPDAHRSRNSLVTTAGMGGWRYEPPEERNASMCEHSSRPTAVIPARTSAETLLDLSTCADAIASKLANQETHPKLWSIYRATVFTALVEHMSRQPIPEVMR